MVDTTIWLILISSLGLTLAAFFGVYLLSSKAYRSLPNTLLALLLLALSVRTGKAVFYSFIDLPAYMKNLALAANLAAGPLLYFYGKSLLQVCKWKKIWLLHFLPAFIYLVGAWSIPNSPDHTIWKIGYALILLHSYVYVYFSLKTATKMSHNTRHGAWYLSLTLGLLIMWLFYGLVFLKILPYHIAGNISFSILMLVLTVIALNRSTLFKDYSSKKYKDSRYTDRELQKYMSQIKAVIHEEELYLQPDLSLSKLSERLNIHPKVISETINRHLGQNFVSFINNYRIEKAKQLLKDQPHYKIAAIAYDCGFNSLSAFNLAFKNSTSRTPSEFRAIKITS